MESALSSHGLSRPSSPSSLGQRSPPPSSGARPPSSPHATPSRGCSLPPFLPPPLFLPPPTPALPFSAALPHPLAPPLSSPTRVSFPSFLSSVPSPSPTPSSPLLLSLPLLSFPPQRPPPPFPLCLPCKLGLRFSPLPVPSLVLPLPLLVRSLASRSHAPHLGGIQANPAVSGPTPRFCPSPSPFLPSTPPSQQSPYPFLLPTDFTPSPEFSFRLDSPQSPPLLALQSHSGVPAPCPALDSPVSVLRSRPVPSLSPFPAPSHWTLPLSRGTLLPLLGILPAGPSRPLPTCSHRASSSPCHPLQFPSLPLCA